MLKIGLSGNRYSGKNRVASLFNQIGIPVFEADVILKFILQHNYELQAEISDKVGRVYFKDGLLNEDKVKSDGKFQKILDIVKPELLSAWNKFVTKNKKAIYCIFHSSILFESGLYKEMDQNISVFSPYVDRVERCKFLTKKSVSSIYTLTRTEMDELEKNKLSKYVIHNYNVDNSFYGDALTQVNQIDQLIIDNYLKDNMSKKEFAL